MEKSMLPEKEIFSQIESMLQAEDEKERFVGLYFAMKLCQDRDDNLILKKLLEYVLYDQSDLIKIQIMWISSIFPFWMLDTANNLIISNMTSSNPSVRLAVLELIRSISKKRSDYLWMLDRFVQDMHPLIFAELNLMSNDSSLLQGVMDSINLVLQSEDEQGRHTALYLLTKLQDCSECYDFIEEKLWNAMQDTPWIQMQALWVMSECVCIDKQSDRIRNLSYQVVQSKDWHIRFGGILLLFKVISSDDGHSYEEILKVYQLCERDDNQFIRMLGECLQLNSL